MSEVLNRIARPLQSLRSVYACVLTDAQKREMQQESFFRSALND
ncbi:hypothetical protein HOE425_332515 [Hoeflea sp. EC-HK425]|nr:hypothetical protein HOE425_332515 [Hoeflea sp. EC-HK425]